MRREYKKNRKIYKEQTDEGNEHSDEGVVVDDDDGEFELVKMKKMKKKKEKKKVIHDVMSDEDLDEILREYAVAYDNKPKSVAQIQAFGKEIGRNYKWKAVRIAFSRWVEFRDGKMPQNKQ